MDRYLVQMIRQPTESHNPTKTDKTHPKIMIDPPNGVIGPAHLPTFSLAKTKGKILPENMTVPAAMASAGKASLPRPIENRGWREMAKSETPLKMR